MQLQTKDVPPTQPGAQVVTQLEIGRGQTRPPPAPVCWWVWALTNQLNAVCCCSAVNRCTSSSTTAAQRSSKFRQARQLVRIQPALRAHPAHAAPSRAALSKCAFAAATLAPRCRWAPASGSKSGSRGTDPQLAGARRAACIGACAKKFWPGVGSSWTNRYPTQSVSYEGCSPQIQTGCRGSPIARAADRHQQHRAGTGKATSTPYKTKQLTERQQGERSQPGGAGRCARPPGAASAQKALNHLGPSHRPPRPSPRGSQYHALPENSSRPARQGQHQARPRNPDRAQKLLAP